MRVKKIFRTLGIVIILALLALAISATPALAAPAVTLSQPTGPVGATVYVSGTGFAAGTYTIYFAYGTSYQQVAGVGTVVELAQRKPDNLYEKLLQVNEKKKLVRRPPALSMVKDWVAQAKKMPRVVKY